MRYIIKLIKEEYNNIIGESDNELIRKISFYDMDGTLIYSPEPETSKIIYKNKTGNDWPYTGWWGRLESLDSNIFDIQYNKHIVDRLNKDNSDPNTKTVLLTARIPKFNEMVKILLNNMGITLDDYTFKNGGDEKDFRILKYIKNYPNVKEIDVYDDRDKEILILIKLKNTLKDMGIKLNIYKVIDNKIINK